MPEPQIAEPGLRYRPEIDGLRAVAVLGVMASHYGIRALRGGFVGVDVFFVISGFLITRMISTEIQHRQYSIWAFYERRARRILPALFFMLFIATVTAFAILFPTDLLEYSRALFATILFASNIEFWRLAQDYFRAQDAVQPLLHTWSLGVEEQFYLFFPLILLAVARLGRPIKLSVLGLLWIGSFVVSCWSVYAHPVSAFYLLPSRFWELLCGSLLAEARLKTPSALASAIGSTVGLVAIFVGMVLLVPGDTPFPGIAAVLPCGGTALTIWASQNKSSVGGRLLAARPIVFVGLISYSLYLWHWPVLVYLRYVQGAKPSAISLLLGAALSFGLAVVSWRWIERPFRGHASKVSVKLLLSGMAVCSLIFIAACGIARFYNGLPTRYAPNINRILAVKNQTYNSICFDAENSAAELQSRCKIGVTTASPDFVVWGDSHADAILPAIKSAALRAGRAGLVILTHDCQPFAGGYSSNVACPKSNAVALQVLQTKALTTVFLVGNWLERAPEGKDYVARLQSGITNLERSGKTVILVADVPNQHFSVPDALAKHLLFGVHPKIWLSSKEYSEQQAFLLDAARHWVGRQFQIISLASILCAKPICPVEKDGRPLYRDTAHLTRFGASQVSPLFVSMF